MTDETRVEARAPGDSAPDHRRQEPQRTSNRHGRAHQNGVRYITAAPALSWDGRLARNPPTFGARLSHSMPGCRHSFTVLRTGIELEGATEATKFAQ